MTDTDALTERLYQEAFEDRYPGYSWESALEYVKEAHRAKYAAVLLPIIAEEVRKAKAEALRETADWWAANPDDDAFETDRDTRNWLRDVATEYETGDGDEHR